MTQVETPYDRLKRRLDSEFLKKRLVGDIVISNEEYDLLTDRLKDAYRRLSCGNTQIVPPDSVLTMALVQIGIKYYDGNFWNKVADIIPQAHIPPSIQTALGTAAWKTFKHFNLPVLGKSERVKTILMHGFVSDYYADDLFEFLFHFYRLDLERNFQQLDDELLNELVAVMGRTDNTGRTYWLKIQTADAVALNPRLSAIRVKHMLRLIDQRFWEGKIPKAFDDRLTELFVHWEATSDAFAAYLRKAKKTDGVRKKGARFFTPYLHCKLSTKRFYLICPTQIVPSDYTGSVHWRITIGKKVINSPDLQLYSGVLGNKTEKTSIELNLDLIFEEISLELLDQSKCFRRFKIDSDTIRFFDKQGDQAKNDALPTGGVYAFTYYNEIPASKAYITSERVGKLLQTYFDFQDGDILRLANGQVLTVGRTPAEGIMPRNKVAGAYVLADRRKQIPLYSKAPLLLLKIPATSAKGTLIIVNGMRMRLFDTESLAIDLYEKNENTGYIINLADFGCNKDGIYEIIIDVPRNHSPKYWRFAVINNFKFKFEDAPYIFVSKGTIRFPEGLSIWSGKSAEKFADENVFRFEIKPWKDYITFCVKAAREKLIVRVYVPVFKWSFKEGNCWQIEQPEDIWHTDLPNVIYLKHPSDSLSLSLDDGIDEHLQEQSINFIKDKAKHMFICSLRRFKSWLSRGKRIRQVNLITGQHKVEFFRIITKSLVKSCLLQIDHENKMLICELDIAGRNEYFTDVIYQGKTLTSKLQIVNGYFQLPVKLIGKEYTIVVFEKEPGLTGFGGIFYSLLDEFTKTVTNLDDLSGNTFEITHIKHNESTISRLNFGCRYIVSNIYRQEGETDAVYHGKLVALRTHDDSFLTSMPIKIEFKPEIMPECVNLLVKSQDPNWPNYYESFLYDAYKKIIVGEELPGLPRAERYRRYITLYANECEYVIRFLEPTLPTENYKGKGFWNNAF